MKKIYFTSNQILVPNKVLLDSRLYNETKAIAAAICAFDHRGCTVAEIADYLNCSEDRVLKHINYLLEAGHGDIFKVVDTSDNKKKVTERRAAAKWDPAQAQRSGLCGERTHNEVNEPCRLRRGE